MGRFIWGNQMIKITVSGLPGGMKEFSDIRQAFEVVQSEEFFRAIGEFIFKFSELEYYLRAGLKKKLSDFSQL
jgi:hypothetical protein